MADGYDVTVRMPVTSESMGEIAAWVSVVIDEAMRKKDWNWTGSTAVLFRRDGNGPIIMFHEGMFGPYVGELPHNLVDPYAGVFPDSSTQEQKAIEALNNLKDSINEAKVAFHEMVVELRSLRRERRNRKK